MKTKDYYINLIKCIGEIDNGTSPCTWNEFKKCGEIIFGVCPRTVGGFKVYRANFITEFHSRLDSISGFSYPPENSPQGRCNLKDKPVFYCTPSVLGAINETLITRKNDNVLDEFNYTIYISEWEMQEKLRCNIYDTNINLDLVFFSDEDRTNKREMESYQRLYQNFINKIFRSKRGHEISSNFSDMLMYGTNGLSEISEPCKFINYNSVAKNGLFPNLAIHPSIINDEILTFNKVLKIKLPSLDFNTIISLEHLDFEVLKTGLRKNINTKSIYWRDPKKSDYNYI